MKPLKLKLSAFGNYAKEQTIDFSKLNGKNLFLITGNTGAGKTTIFDAISYALYGSPSGDFRDTASLRSHYVDGNVETFVELEFQIRDNIYNIRRSPEQLLNKKRGEGYKKEAAKVELTFLHSDEKPLTKVKDVEDRINELLGVDKDQFRQIVMLPQGEFLKLLKANSKDREEIFRKIFGTEGFKRIQDDLREKVKKLWVDLKDSKNERDLYVRQLKAEDESLLEGFINSEDIDIERVIELTLEQIENDKNNNEEAKEQCLKIREEIKVLDSKIEKIEQHKKIIVDYEKSARNLEEHRAKAEVVKEYEIKLTDARKAEKIKVIENKINDEIKNKENKTHKLAEIKKKKDEVIIQLDEADKCLKESKGRTKERESLIVRIETLKGQKVSALNYVDKKSRVSKLEKELKDNEILEKNLKEQITKLEKLIKSSNDEINKAIIAEGKAALISQKGKEHKKDIDALRDLKNHYETMRFKRVDYDKKKSEFEAIDSKFKKIKKSFEESEDAFKRGQAGLLAENLEDGMPCLVCGSLKHPKKALKPKDILSEDEIKKLKESYDRTNEERENVLRELTVINKEIENFYNDVIKSKVGDLSAILEEGFLTSLNESEQREKIISEGIKLNDVIEAERNEYKALKKIFEVKDDVEKALKDYENQSEKINKELEEINRFINVTSSTLAVEVEGLKKIELEIPENLRDGKAINDEILKLETIVKEIEDSINKWESKFKAINDSFMELKRAEKIYEEEFKNIDRNIEKINEDFKCNLKEQGFNKEEYKIALTFDNLDLIEKKIKAYYENLKALEALFEKDSKSLESIEIKDVKTLDVHKDKLKEEYGELEKSEVIKNKECNLFSNRVEHNKSIVKNIKEIRMKIGEREKVYEKLSHLSNIANGDKGNLKKITFESYVLTSYFDEIIIRANFRLDKMTNGRFLLKRKEDLGKGNKKQGLDLEVFDNNTGRERGVNSLSGGESFKTALCLALGLADVIQNYAGGISIDTMFLDEGFGTLDPQSLDNAIECLINLQQGGRLVGIISHVDELKERIEVKLEVKSKDGEGSTAIFSIPGH